MNTNDRIVRKSLLLLACLITTGLFWSIPVIAQDGATVVVREKGELAAGDSASEDGKLWDRYTFTIDAPREVVARVVSSEFDTYIQYRGPGEVSGENDDFEGTSVSQVTFWALEPGEYWVDATSYQAAATGAYEIEILISQEAEVETREGRLDPRDSRAPKGEYYDAHELSLGAGESVSVSLESFGFDGVVTAQGPDGQVLVEDGSIRLATLGPLTGPADWTVFATSYAASELGAYDIRVIRRPPGQSAPTPTLLSPEAADWEVLEIRSRVVRGPDWAWDDQGGDTVGTVTGQSGPVGWYSVAWDNGETNNYRWGQVGSYQLEVVSPVTPEAITSSSTKFFGDRLRVRSDAAAIQVDQWRPEMDPLQGEVLRIQEISDEGIFLFTPDETDYYLFRWDAVELVRKDQ